jgi:hypothetical protein
LNHDLLFGSLDEALLELRPSRMRVAAIPELRSGQPGRCKIFAIGSTVDPRNGDQNPYGLAIAPTTTRLVIAGDLVVCNFNDGPTADDVANDNAVVSPKIYFNDDNDNTVKLLTP